jgi:iron complex outermembrane receptor protein
MKKYNPNWSALRILLSLSLAATAAVAQDPDPNDEGLQEVVVTGSRIIQSSANAQQPISIIDRATIERTGLASVGELLQQVTAGGKALNAKFNSSGNFGYPADGGGIGAGSAQVDLRSLGSKRVLVLVDGIRWVNESSASGVSGAADLNTIPMSIIDRIEVLEDGASAIYGSDAIAGVVNIITRKKFDGVELNAYRGEYELGGPTTDASITVGGGGERFSGLFVASFYEQEEIGSGEWEQSSFPQPLAGLAAGSSGLPQGRYTFCDPARPASTYGSCTTPDDFYDITLNNGTTTPVWNPANPSAGTYHNFSGADRFNFAPFNLLLTPSKRKSMFARMSFDLTDAVSINVKGLFNNRQSSNRAAPEPIFVGPYAGTGGLADTISISALNPFNPFGIDLDAASNFGWVTRRPLEVGPRLFEQDVDTWYFNVGLEGTFGADSRFHWDVNFATSENNAAQRFTNGYNIGKIQLALGDPAICALVPGCTPLDLFGGQGRPFTPAMIDYIRTTQIDSSKQTLQLISANVTGDLFDIGDRAAGFAVGAEHRKYAGEFQPDPLRATGESQDSFASPVSADYDVNELYAEFSFPLLETLDASAAVRYSDYSTFGNETTGKVGLRWQPVEAIALRGTYSSGFRAPNLGELFGLTQFAATLTDPCGPTGAPPVVFDGDGPNTTPLETACRAQGVPSGFEQANTQITTFTGGNPDLQPEKSDSFTVGLVHNATWSEGFADRLTFELTYYSHEIESGIQARDLAALLGACLGAGGTDATLCSPFTRAGSGNLNPPNNFLDNLGSLETDGFDFKVDWRGNAMSWGTLSAGLQATRVNDFTATDTDGIVSQRAVGIEVSDSAIPKLQANLQLAWEKGAWGVSFNTRYIDSVKEYCGNASVTNVPGCSAGQTFNTLDSTIYNDAQVAWNKAFGMDNFKLALGVNNIFGEDPPICYSCSLNGYDAGTYDLPGSFWAVTAKYGF